MKKDVLFRIKSLHSLKILFSFFVLLIIPRYSAGQTLIAIKAGINWTNFRDVENKKTLYGTASYGFGLDIKGRKPKPIHIGASIEFLRNSFHWETTSHSGLGDTKPNGQNIHYAVEWLRLSIYPEIAFGKRFQVNFHFSPYVGIKLHSSKDGISWTTNDQYQKIIHNVSGSAKDDFVTVDIGFQENLGFGFAVLPYLVLSLEENYCFGITSVNKVTNGSLKTRSLSVFFCTSFIIPPSKSKEKKKSDDTPN
ncbi:MAG: hypothetical protein NTW10_00605 [Bacteroidetes bacterium]|nr:hypothetical protein [Bacteroidota bacterium]